jgi:hypothetical protein
MKRREFIGLVGGTVAAWSLAASAQQKPVIGFLNSGSADAYPDRVTAFHQGLRQLAILMAKTSSLIIAGRLASTTDCLDLRRNLWSATYPYWLQQAGSQRPWRPNRRLRRYRSSLQSAATPSSSAWSPAIIGRVEMRQAQTFWLPRWTASVLDYCTS